MGKRVHPADAVAANKMSSEAYKRLLARQHHPRAVPSRATSDRNLLLKGLEDEDIVVSEMGSVRLSQDAEQSATEASNAGPAKSFRPKDLSSVRV